MKTVTFKAHEFTYEEKGETKTGEELFKLPGKEGQIMKPGETKLVTDKAAKWLEVRGFIEPLKKENKAAAKRETK